VQERRCTDEWQAKASRLENDVKALEEDVRVMHTLKMDLDVATNRLRNLESLQSRVQVYLVNISFLPTPILRESGDIDKCFNCEILKQAHINPSTHTHTHTQAEAKHREDFRKQFRGPHGIPYQQLARMLEVYRDRDTRCIKYELT
jgi:hypothetical protein